MPKFDIHSYDVVVAIVFAVVVVAAASVVVVVVPHMCTPVIPGVLPNIDFTVCMFLFAKISRELFVVL